MIWPIKPSPQSILGGMMGLFMVGCVSISTHEKAKVESVEYGERDMAERCLKLLNSKELTKEEIAYELQSFLDLEDMKK